MDKEKSLRDTKLYVNLDKFQSNIKSIKSLIGNQTQIMAILKANAYGHGLAELVEPAISAGVSYIGVATLKEAITVREQNKSVPILILGYTPEHLFDVVVENKITQTIFDLDSAKKLNDISSLRGHKTNIHIKVDTGLHRLGFPDTSKSIDVFERFLFLKKILRQLQHCPCEILSRHKPMPRLLPCPIDTQENRQ